METLTAALMMIAPFVVLCNCVMICSLVKKANRFEKALARYEDRDRLRLEKDTKEALMLLRTGKIDDAKVVAERIISP